MIEADGPYTLRTGTKTQIDPSADIYVSVRVDGKDRVATIGINAFYNGQIVDGKTLVVNEARFDTLPKNGGTAEFSWFINVAEQIVVEELQDMPENSGVGFTIS